MFPLMVGREGGTAQRGAVWLPQAPKQGEGLTHLCILSAGHKVSVAHRFLNSRQPPALGRNSPGLSPTQYTRGSGGPVCIVFLVPLTLSLIPTLTSPPSPSFSAP